MARILIVDDEPSVRCLLQMALEETRHVITLAEDGTRALELLQQNQFDIVISDMKMPGMTGIDVLSQVREKFPSIVVIMMTAFATVEKARQAFRLGATDFIMKGQSFDVAEVLKAVEAAVDRARGPRAGLSGRKQRRARSSIIGGSRETRALLEMIDTVAGATATVLITGESGTGKEMVARAIHKTSDRAAAPFVSINCGAFAESLLESELFGYVRGAFTGALANRKGLFEAAEGGIIFLDEIGEMSPAMQVKLLRVLQERKVRRVGSSEEMAITCRVLAATNRDLARMVAEGTFRQDLYYRVNVIQLELPPLRSREGDLPALVDHFLIKFGAAFGKDCRISDEAIRYLERYHWPGNVRELENTIERALVIARGNVITPELLPETILGYRQPIIGAHELPDVGFDLHAFIEDLMRTYIVRALRRAGGHRSSAAAMLRISKRSMRHHMEKFHLVHEFRAGGADEQ